jgi:hypothetical protein
VLLPGMSSCRAFRTHNGLAPSYAAESELPSHPLGCPPRSLARVASEVKKTAGLQEMKFFALWKSAGAGAPVDVMDLTSIGLRRGGQQLRGKQSGMCALTPFPGVSGGGIKRMASTGPAASLKNGQMAGGRSPILREMFCIAQHRGVGSDVLPLV